MSENYTWKGDTVGMTEPSLSSKPLPLWSEMARRYADGASPLMGLIQKPKIPHDVIKFFDEFTTKWSINQAGAVDVAVPGYQNLCQNWKVAVRFVLDYNDKTRGFDLNYLIPSYIKDEYVQQKRTMNNTYILSLVDENLKQLECKFWHRKYGKWQESEDTWTYVTHLDVKKDDFVIVEARGNICVCQVTEVSECCVEEHDDIDYKWAFAKFDGNPKEMYDALEEMRETVCKKFNSVKKKAQRKQLQNALKDEIGKDLFKQLTTSIDV
jgi:hypothetical protein